MNRLLDRPDVWAFVRNEIIRNPKLAAQKLGIEEIGYLTDLKIPEAWLTLAQAGKVYADLAKVSRNEHARIRRAWGEFSALVGVGTIKEIDHAIAERFERSLAVLGLAPKTVKHRVGAVRTVLAFAMKRGKSVAHCRAALDALSMLTVQNANPLDPRPISVSDFWALHAVAVKAGDKPFVAMLLLALNAAMYSAEVAVLKWSDVDLDRGELATRRNKTGVPRVAVLWPETVKALRELDRHEHVGRLFYTPIGGVMYRQAISRKWIEFRAAAGVASEVVFSQLRDAAFTIAARVDLDAARLLNGHKLPGSVDNYVLRQPQAVAEVCNAIREAFEVEKHCSA